ncbi:hypothetical protein V5E97_10300 [Singulisphaera sp. Ch08]|uniref:Uncharacterized protein n=1 Tax=Singulisphaera sp. Ch08 TaxID=3120278 RepID=A0AAU7CMS9_9BACT
MTAVHRTIAALRVLSRLHGDTGQVPVVELEVLIAELDSAEDERPSPGSGSDPARRSDLEINRHGYPRGLEQP